MMYEALVSVPLKGYSNQVTKMTVSVRSYAEAKAYFLQFGEIVSGPRLAQ